MKQTKIIAVDLDGVIFEADLPQFLKYGLDYFGKVMPDAKLALELLKSNGWKIIIHTCRLNPNTEMNKEYTIPELREKVRAMLEKEGIPYDEIFAGKGKPLADFYIDDRAIRFENWIQVIDELEPCKYWSQRL